MLIQYVRDYQNRPFGCVVALDENLIGWSLCNPKDKRFLKKRAVEIASGRAMLGCTLAKIPDYRLEAVTAVIEDVKREAEQYFHRSGIVNSSL